MSKNNFEDILKENRTWLSKYGGFITLLIIILIIASTSLVTIPEYKIVTINELNNKELNISFSSLNFKLQKEDILPLVLDKESVSYYTISSLSEKDSVYSVTLSPINMEKYNSIKSIRPKAGKVIYKEQSMIKSLLNPVFGNVFN